MVSRIIVFVSILLVASLATAQSPVIWSKLPGGATDIGANAKGDLWMVGSSPPGPDYTIYHWILGQWVPVAGATGKRIAVDPAGNAWVVRDKGAIMRYTASGWQTVPGSAMDIGIGANGTVWIIGPDQSISRLNSQSPYVWQKFTGGAVRIAVDLAGNPWIVNAGGQIYHLVGANWVLVAGAAKDIAVDAVGIVYTIGTAAAPGGFVVNRLLGQQWVPERAAGINIAAGPSGAAYLTQNATSADAIMTRALVASNTITTPVVINQPTPTPAPPLQVTDLGYTPITVPRGAVTLVPGLQYVHVAGTLLCSDPEAIGHCGTVDAGVVGRYQLNLTCSSGFYDPMDGGTCWQCPSDDGHGAYIRSADSVTSDTACWRNATSAAVWDGYGLAWNCSANQFWDSQDNHGNIKGSCWNCPSAYPTRSANPVWSSTACYSHQTSPATFLAYNGCPKPDKTKMYPNDKRRPGEAFLDLSGLTLGPQGFQGAECYACPVTDETGNYLIAPRGSNSLLNRVNNAGCQVQMKYTPGTFVEPGLSSLPGASDVLNQEQVFQRPNSLTKYLFDMATQRKLSGTQATQWVSAQWKDIAAHPYQNDNIRALVYQYMLGHAPAYMYASGTPASGVAEQRLVAAFQAYIQARRTHVAQESLDMYYAWQKNLANTRASHAQSQLQVLFYYGTVPLDFSSVVAAALVPSSLGVGVLTATWAGETFNIGVATNTVGKITTIPRAMSLFQAFSSFDAFAELDTLAQIDVISGPVGIAFAGATMAAMSIQQVVQIATAEQNLKDARDKAKNTPIDVVAMYNGPNGADQVALYWADAMGVASELGNRKLNAAAQSAYAAAQTANFAH